MFDASTLEAWSVVSRRLSWPIGLGIYRLNVCRLSLHGLEAASPSVLRVMGSSYVHCDRTIVPATGCIRGVILWVSSLIDGSVHIGISIVPLVVWDVVVSMVP